MFSGVPAEVQILNVYLPPLFLAIMAGLLCTLVVTKLLNRTGLSRFFWHPPLAGAALWLLATALISFFFITP
jgi:hypothetical protein